MNRDLHDDCLRTLRRHQANLSEREKTVLNYVAGMLAAGEKPEEAKLATAIVWSFHSQGPGRTQPLA